MRRRPSPSPRCGGRLVALRSRPAEGSGGSSDDEDPGHQTIQTYTTRPTPQLHEARDPALHRADQFENGDAAVKSCEDQHRRRRRRLGRHQPTSRWPVTRPPPRVAFQGARFDGQTAQLSLTKVKDGSGSSTTSTASPTSIGEVPRRLQGAATSSRPATSKQADCLTEALGKVARRAAQQLFLSGDPNKFVARPLPPEPERRPAQPGAWLCSVGANRRRVRSLRSSPGRQTERLLAELNAPSARRSRTARGRCWSSPGPARARRGC